MTLLLDIDPEAQAYFDNLRQQFFPKHKLRDNAHITLLYQIHEAPEKVMDKLSAITFPQFSIRATGILPFSTGNAVRLESEALLELHATLKKTFRGRISRRDLVRYHPHLTIQLHVTAFKAQRTLKDLEGVFVPFEFAARGMSLWVKDKQESAMVRSLPFPAT